MFQPHATTQAVISNNGMVRRPATARKRMFSSLWKRSFFCVPHEASQSHVALATRARIVVSVVTLRTCWRTLLRSVGPSSQGPCTEARAK